MSTELDDLLAKISKTLDVYEFLDILGWTMDDLVNALEDEVFEHMDAFRSAVE